MKLLLIAALIVPLACAADDLITKNGRKYTDYSVIKVLKRGIQIMHASGGCTVPFDQLPDDVRAEFRSQEEKFIAEQNQKKIQRERQTLLKNIELSLYEFASVVKVVDGKTCIVRTKRSFNEFVVEDVDAKNLFDGGVFPHLDPHPKDPKLTKKKPLYYVGSRTLRGRKYMLFTLDEDRALKFVKSNPDARVPAMKEPPPSGGGIGPPPVRRSARPSPAVPVNSIEAVLLQNRSFY